MLVDVEVYEFPNEPTNKLSKEELVDYFIGTQPYLTLDHVTYDAEADTFVMTLTRDGWYIINVVRTN